MWPSDQPLASGMYRISVCPGTFIPDIIADDILNEDVADSEDTFTNLQLLLTSK